VRQGDVEKLLQALGLIVKAEEPPEYKRLRAAVHDCGTPSGRTIHKIQQRILGLSRILGKASGRRGLGLTDGEFEKARLLCIDTSFQKLFPSTRNTVINGLDLSRKSPGIYGKTVNIGRQISDAHQWDFPVLRCHNHANHGLWYRYVAHSPTLIRSHNGPDHKYCRIQCGWSSCHVNARGVPTLPVKMTLECSCLMLRNHPALPRLSLKREKLTTLYVLYYDFPTNSTFTFTSQVVLNVRSGPWVLTNYICRLSCLQLTTD
jgi:hypothetical protein